MSRRIKRIATAVRGVFFSAIWLFRMLALSVFLSIGRFILFPLNALINLFLMAVTCREWAQKPTAGNAFNALVEALTGAAIMVALIGSLVMGAEFAAVVAPLILLISFSIRAIKSLCYDLSRHAKNLSTILPNLLNFLSSLLSATVIGGVLLAGVVLLEPLGIVAGLLSTLAAGLLLKEQLDKETTDKKNDQPLPPPSPCPPPVRPLGSALQAESIVHRALAVTSLALQAPPTASPASLTKGH